MEQRDIRYDAVLTHGENHIPVQLDSLRIDLAAAVGNQSRPVDRKTIGLNSQIAHQRIVLSVAVHMVTAHGSVLLFKYPALFHKGVPDVLASSVIGVCPFDLIGAAGNTPYKILAKHNDSS